MRITTILGDIVSVNHFFEFSSKLVGSTFQARPTNLKTTEGIRGHLRLISGQFVSLEFPIVFVQEYGYKLTDILDTGHTSLYLLSDHLKNLLEENLFTGWKTFPIRLFDKKKNEIFGYHGFSVTGRCGPVDFSKSPIIEKSVVPGGALWKYYRGVYVGLDQWDGTDFFLPEKTIRIVVTEQVSKVLKANKITNLELRNLATIEHAVD